MRRYIKMSSSFYSWYDRLSSKDQAKVDDLADEMGLPYYEDCTSGELSQLHDAFVSSSNKDSIEAKTYSKAPSLKWIAEQANILEEICNTTSEEDVDHILRGYPGLRDIAETNGRSGVIKKLVDTIEMLAKGCDYGSLSEVAACGYVSASQNICGDEDFEDADLYVVKIWYEVDPGHDTIGPQAAEEIIQTYATSPDEALEYAKKAWKGPIDRIEIIDVNPLTALEIDNFDGFDDIPYND